MTLTSKAAIALMLTFSATLQVAAAQQEAARPAERGVINFVTPILPDPALQHSKETYVLYGCAYCHGVDLRVRNGEAADLLHSPLVRADVDGSVISHVLRVGIPQTAKLSPMPQFSDLSDRELADIARWIHYSRAQGHFAELMQDRDVAVGSSTAGKAYFEKSCSTCHSTGDIAKAVKGVKDADLKAFIIRPAFLQSTLSFDVSKRTEKEFTGRAKHGTLLENYTSAEVADLLAYIKTIK